MRQPTQECPDWNWLGLWCYHPRSFVACC